MRKLILATTLITLSGCAALPSTGPSRSQFQVSESVGLVPVSSQLAEQMRHDLNAQTQSETEHSVGLLKSVTQTGDRQLIAGDTIDIKLMSWSTLTTGTSTENFTIQLDAQGNMLLPYTEDVVHVAGMTLVELERNMATSYRQKKIFLDPSIQVSLSPKNGSHGIVVTGNVGAPKIIPWVPGGMTLAQVITMSIGDGQVIGQQQSDPTGQKSATVVTVVRPGIGGIDIPLDVALRDEIPVQNTDKIIITRKPTVKVTVTGGGITNGAFGFDAHPTLAQVIAEAKGLNPQTADAKSVFVLRHNDTKIIYQFSFKTVDAQFASQEFPLMDGDIVYVSEATIVPLTQVMSSLWPLVTLTTFAK